MLPSDVRYRERHFKADTRAILGSRVDDSRLVVPDNVERLLSHVPCPNCGVREGCRHRPWMLRGGE